MSLLNSKPFHQSDQHAANFLRQAFGYFSFLCGPHVPTPSDYKLRLHFAVRSSGMAKKLQILASCRSSVSFCDIAGHRYGCTAKLTCEAESLRCRKRFGQPIYSEAQLDRSLPNQEILK